MAVSQAKLFDYEGFVGKFEPKKTTDDCYTPPEVYDAVAAYVERRYGVDPADMVRPFFPGGDYRGFDYPEGCCVVDNPPFSILSEIVGFYVSQQVPFFLFAPALTCFNVLRRNIGKVTALACAVPVTYANGAVVRTSFLTSLSPSIACESCPDLTGAVEGAVAEIRNRDAVRLPKYEFPADVLTAARLGWMSGHGATFSVRADECAFICGLDAMRAAGKSGIFGGGLLLSSHAAEGRAAVERAAVERAAVERAAVERWQLSERERGIQAMLGKGGEG